MDYIIEVVEVKRTIVLLEKQEELLDPTVKAVNLVLNNMGEGKVLDTHFAVEGFEHSLEYSTPMDAI